MALLHMEGFDGSGTTQSSIRWYLRKMYPSHTPWANLGETAAGRGSGRCWKGIASDYMLIPFESKTTIVVGFAYKISAWTAGEDVVAFRDDFTWQLRLELAVGGEFKLYCGAVLLGTTVGVNCAINTWYYVELKATIGSGVDGSFELHVDGVDVLNDTGIDTHNGGAVSVNNVGLLMNAGVRNRYYDDIYILDTTGAANNDFLGDMKVIMLSPNGDGDSNDFTIFPDTGEDHYEDVDDGVTPDFDTTYVESNTSGHKELYTFPATTDLANIAGVMLITDAEKTEASKQTLKLLAKHGVTESSETQKSLPSDYVMPHRLMELDPFDDAWTQPILNATQFGFEIV